jgi:signal transduction histidine kinase
MSLNRALLILVATVLVAAVVPGGLLVERRLGRALVARTRAEVATAPMVLKDRMAAARDARMMHAREIAHAAGLADALALGDLQGAQAIVSRAAEPFTEEPLLVLPDGESVAGPADFPMGMVEMTRQGEMPVAVVQVDTSLHFAALAPIESEGTWLGAAGGTTRVGEGEAGTLAGLTRSSVIIHRPDGHVVSAAGDTVVAAELALYLASMPPADTVRQITLNGSAYIVASAPYDSAASVAFVRDLTHELAILPDLRRTAVWSAAIALLLALAVGALFATRVARPVGALADVAARFAAGDVDAPLPRSSLTEVRRVAEAFGSMREALAARLADLEEANRALEDRQERLGLLQAELLQRERMAATGRLMAQLAHEIRNPVASVRNCLEVVRRKARLEGEAREFADMAVDELLRMHELAERMLDFHRPPEPGERSCEVGRVARNVAQLVHAGNGETRIVVLGDADARAGIPPAALKQVLLNLVLNATDVTPEDVSVEIVVDHSGDTITIEVLDRGPGIPEESLPRVFDPFFTTKKDVHGVGLGLFTAEGLVRTHGGRIWAENRAEGPGARFAVELPVATESAASAPDQAGGRPA